MEPNGVQTTPPAAAPEAAPPAVADQFTPEAILAKLQGVEAPVAQAQTAQVPAEPTPQASSAPTSTGRQRGPDGKFLPKTEAAPPAPEPVVEFGEYGAVKLSEVPSFHKQMVEFHQKQIEARAVAAEQEKAALAEQFKSLQAQAQEAINDREYIAQWAKSDPHGLAAYVNERAQAQIPQYGAPQPQMRQPAAPQQQGDPLDKPLTMREWNALKAQEAQEAQRQQERNVKLQNVGVQIAEIINREIPQAEWGEVHPELLQAIQRDIVGANKKGVLVEGLPENVTMRVVGNIILGVKKRFSALRQQIQAKQAAITQAVAPQPVGGQTLMPRSEPESYEPFNENKAAESYVNRIQQYQNGIF